MSEESGSSRFEINVKAVWAHMATGGGAYTLNETMADMGVRGLTGKSFTDIENEIGHWWPRMLHQEMKEAGNEERMNAIKNKRFHQDVPWCQVVVDCGWSKTVHYYCWGFHKENTPHA